MCVASVSGGFAMEFADLIKTPKLDGVLLHDPGQAGTGTGAGATVGTLCITGHHLLLSARQENSQELWVSAVGMCFGSNGA